MADVPPPPQMQLAASMPTMAFVAGMLLPAGSFRIDMSKIQPGACGLVVVRTPHLPVRIAEIVDMATGPGGMPTDDTRPPDVWARVFASMVTNVRGVGVPVMMELKVTSIAWAVPAKPAKSGAAQG